jgi:hypothetical protein
VSDVFRQVSALGSSLVQRSPTECRVPEWDREASTMGRPWPIEGCCAIGKKNYPLNADLLPPQLVQNIPVSQETKTFPIEFLKDRFLCENDDESSFSIKGKDSCSQFGDYQVFALLRCYAALIDSYRRFGTRHQSHLQGSDRLGYSVVYLTIHSTTKSLGWRIAN